MKKAKKGFTIVELVVVIAVIAILAAVLIPTFISIVNRAKVSNDNQLVRNLNTALITEEADGNKAENMSQAIEIAEDYGYKLENLQAKADGYVLLWNQTTNRFYVESAEGTITSNPEVTDFPAENYTYWEISKTLGTNHSTYLTEGSGDIEAINLGVDVSGISSAVNVTYTGNENKVIIATNGGDLTVDAATGHVAHYGFVKNLTVNAVNGADCYREHGYVGTLKSFGTGKFVAEKGSQFHQTEEQIKTAVKPESNTFVDLGATYGVHKRDENGICVICNDGGTPSVKNGLVDGYYYKDDVLYTGTETDNGTTYTFENGRLVVKSKYEYIESNIDTHDFTVDTGAISEKYLTDEIITYVDSVAYNTPDYTSLIHNVINHKDYSIVDVAVDYACSGLLNGVRWTNSEYDSYKKYVESLPGYDGNVAPMYSQNYDYTNYFGNDALKSAITYSEYLKLKYVLSVFPLSVNSAMECYFTKTNSEEQIFAYSYEYENIGGVQFYPRADGKIYWNAWGQGGPKALFLKDEEELTGTKQYGKFKITVTDNIYSVYYNNELCDTLEFHMKEIENFDVNSYRAQLSNYSLNSISESEKLYWITSTSDRKGEIVYDTDIIGMYITALNKMYNIVFSNGGRYTVEQFNDLSTADKVNALTADYFYIDFSPAVSNWNNNMKLAGPVIRIVLSKNA